MGVTKALAGDLFASDAQTLVNTVNCVGVMGKGIALEFKERFPEMYKEYVSLCEQGAMHLGQPYLHRPLTEPWVLLFPTKDHWRSVARLHDIVRGLEYLKAHYRDWGIASLAVPPLGCGQGKLDWRIVGPTLFRHLQDLAIPVELYAPRGTVGTELTHEFLSTTRSGPTFFGSAKLDQTAAAWLGVVDILDHVEKHPYHWPTGRVIFHKMLYFSTESGLPTGLRFEPGAYGPYSAAAESLVGRLVNNGLIVESKLGRMFQIKVGPAFSDARRAYSAQLGLWAPIRQRVADLFLRVNTHEAEVAATVHYTATHLLPRDTKSTELDVLSRVMQWKQNRQPQWSEAEVSAVIRRLNMLGWIDVRGSKDLPLP